MLQELFTHIWPVTGQNMNFHNIPNIPQTSVSKYMLLALCYITPLKHTVVTYHAQTVSNNKFLTPNDLKAF